MRKQKEIGGAVLARAGRFHEVGDRRYIIGLNEEEERKDEAAREAVGLSCPVRPA